MLPFARVTILGLGLIGSSIARGVLQAMPTVRLTGYDADPAVRATADRLELCHDIADTAGCAVIDADLVILCVPVGAVAAVADEIAGDLPADAVVTYAWPNQFVANSLGMVAAFGLSLLAGWALYRGVESPSAPWRGQRLPRLIRP